VKAPPLRLAKLIGWSEVPGRDAITKQFRFDDFHHAFGSWRPQRLWQTDEPPPEWTTYYNKVDITLSTHDAGGVTELDITLAEAMDKLVTTSPQPSVGIPGLQA